MEYKYINLFLVFVIVILLSMNYKISNNLEKFSPSQKNKAEEPVTGGNLKDMLESLSNSEALCDEMNKREEHINTLKQFQINKETLNELSVQKKRIEELKNVLNYLRLEQTKREQISNTCRDKTQEEINKDFEISAKAKDNGLLKDTSKKIDLKISDKLLTSLDELKKGSYSTNLASNSSEDAKYFEKIPGLSERQDYKGEIRAKEEGQKCPHMDPKKYIHADDLRNKCHGCNVDNLLANLHNIKKDFK
jgi:hypothetical protein